MEELHLGILILTAITILFSDHLGWQYFRGTRTVLPQLLIRRLHTGIWVGLCGMIVTGIVLSVPRFEYLREEQTFYIKCAFVLILIFNAWVIGRIAPIASERPFTALTRQEKRLLILSGVVSLSSWLGAALIGFLFL